VRVQTIDRLSKSEVQAWAGLLHAHANLVRQLDADLTAQHGISLSAFEVLHRLARTELGRMRMSDLAQVVLLSPSGLSRLVDRMEAEGLIGRVACATDGRSIYATISERGRTRLAEATPTHEQGIRERFLRHFDEAEIARLAEFWGRVAPSCAE
jgi:DNA-binding MarR family transcriptional regulator